MAKQKQSDTGSGSETGEGSTGTAILEDGIRQEQEATLQSRFANYVLPESISPINHGQVRTALVVNRLDDGRLNLCVFVGDPNDLARNKDMPARDNNNRVVTTQLMFGVSYDPEHGEGTWH